ncbi:hypothetical protein ScPMuIL_003015 [Solemya velum]
MVFACPGGKDSDTAPASPAPPSMSAGHRRTQAVDMDLSTSKGIPSTPPLYQYPPTRNFGLSGLSLQSILIVFIIGQLNGD